MKKIVIGFALVAVLAVGGWLVMSRTNPSFSTVEAFTEGETIPIESSFRARHALARLDRLLLASGHWAWLLGENHVDVREEAEALGIAPARLRMIRAIQTVDPDFSEALGATEDEALRLAWQTTRPFATKLEQLHTERQALIEAMRHEPDTSLRALVDAFLELDAELQAFREAHQAARELTEPLRQAIRHRRFNRAS